MKLSLSLCIAALLALASTGWGQGPTVTTTYVSNDVPTSAFLGGYVIPGGTNCACWFNYGATAALGTGPYAFTNAGNGSAGEVTNILIQSALTNLLPGTRYYYQFACSNAATHTVVNGAIDNFATPIVSYNFVGPGIQNLDPTRPYGSEAALDWAPALRQTKAALADFAGSNANVRSALYADGSLKTGVVSFADLTTALQNTITNGTTNIVSVITTNAYTYITSTDYQNQNITGVNTALQALVTLSIPSNNFSKILVTLETQLGNIGSGSTHNFLWYPTTNGFQVVNQEVQSYCENNRVITISSSWLWGNIKTTTSIPVTIIMTSDNNSSNVAIIAAVNNFRMWGIP